MSDLTFERATLIAWPARARETRFGWEFCATGGVPGRANSIWPLAWSGDIAIEDAIAEAAAWCEAHAITPCFRLSDGLFAPPELPEMLRRAGYAPDTETLMMTRVLETPPPARGRQGGGHDPLPVASQPTSPFQGEEFRGVDLLETADETIWSPVRASAPSEADFADRQDIVSRITVPHVFARASLEGAPAAIGLGVMTGDLVGIYLMRTAPEARRRGLARQIVNALLDWSVARGATCAYLQAERSNTAAVALYERAGFNTIYSYSFWKLPSA